MQDLAADPSLAKHKQTLLLEAANQLRVAKVRGHVWVLNQKRCWMPVSLNAAFLTLTADGSAW